MRRGEGEEKGFFAVSRCQHQQASIQSTYTAVDNGFTISILTVIYLVRYTYVGLNSTHYFLACMHLVRLVLSSRALDPGAASTVRLRLCGGGTTGDAVLQDTARAEIQRSAREVQ